MVSFPLSAARTQAQVTLGLVFPSAPQFPSNSVTLLKVTPKCSPSSSTFRCKGSRRRSSQINQRLLAVCATNPHSGGGKLPNEGSDVKETSNAGQGPPLLTIVAGLFVFLIICWVIWPLHWFISISVLVYFLHCWI